MVAVSDFDSLQSASLEADDVIRRAAEVIGAFNEELSNHVCVLLIGSYGRLEARIAVSDLEWLLLFDDERVAYEEATVFQSKVVAALASIVGRNKLSIGKTFGTLCPMSSLRSNIGGVADTNQMLTYRILTLTEGRPLTENPAYDLALRTLAQAYGATHTAGHRLLSLATDISRYWRTLRIDYKYKVDEERRPWAVRSFKLRVVRRFSYLSSAMHFVAFGPRVTSGSADRIKIEDVQTFMRSMSTPPLERLIKAWNRMGGSDKPLRETLALYDGICGRLADPSVRAELDSLESTTRRDNSLYSELRHTTQTLHTQMARLALELPDSYKIELLEMFLL